MNYILKQYNDSLLSFSATTDTSEPEIEILWVNEKKRSQLPLDLDLTPSGVKYWMKKRTVPKNRAFVHNLLAKCSLNLNRPMSIIDICKGLSLNDSYWVVQENDPSTFEDVNLYENRFSTVLAWLAFTGHGSSVRTSLASSPEFTTNGALPKCWRRIDGKIYLYKGGTTGASNCGFEPYSEFYAYQVAQAMGLHAVPYTMSKWKGILCSKCELFTDKETAFLPAGSLVASGGMSAVREYCKNLGPQYWNALADILVFDAVICNTDRHLGNFGFMVDSTTNQIKAPAPMFDHGNSLFNFAGSDCWDDTATLDAYISTLLPSLYDDFIETAKEVMEDRHHHQLRHLLTFRFKKHSRYNLPPRRLRMIEKQVQKRAQLLLSE